jgi:hypothetical protein
VAKAAAARQSELLARIQPARPIDDRLLTQALAKISPYNGAPGSLTPWLEAVRPKLLLSLNPPHHDVRVLVTHGMESSVANLFLTTHEAALKACGSLTELTELMLTCFPDPVTQRALADTWHAARSPPMFEANHGKHGTPAAAAANVQAIRTLVHEEAQVFRRLTTATRGAAAAALAAALSELGHAVSPEVAEQALARSRVDEGPAALRRAHLWRRLDGGFQGELTRTGAMVDAESFEASAAAVLQVAEARLAEYGPRP